MAGIAPERLRLASGPMLNIGGVTAGAVDTLRPTLLDEPLFGEGGAGELLYGLCWGKPCAEVLAGCIEGHVPISHVNVFSTFTS